MNDSLGFLALVSESPGRVCVVLKQSSTLVCHFIFEFSYCYNLKQQVSGKGWHEIALQRCVISRKSHMTLTEESLRRHRASCHRQHDGAFREKKYIFNFQKRSLIGWASWRKELSNQPGPRGLLIFMVSQVSGGQVSHGIYSGLSSC